MKITADKLIAFYETKLAVYLFLVIGAIGTAAYWSLEFNPLVHFSVSYNLLWMIPFILILYVVTTIAGAGLLWLVAMLTTAVWRQTSGVHWALRIPLVIVVTAIWLLMINAPSNY